MEDKLIEFFLNELPSELRPRYHAWLDSGQEEDLIEYFRNAELSEYLENVVELIDNTTSLKRYMVLLREKASKYDAIKDALS